MKKIKILSLLMGLAALFAACENNENEGPEGPEPREQVGRISWGIMESVSYQAFLKSTLAI